MERRGQDWVKCGAESWTERRFLKTKSRLWLRGWWETRSLLVR